MGLNGRLISSKEIVWNVYKNSGASEELPISDLYEWMVTCLEMIYHPTQFERKVVGHVSNPEFDVTNYKVRIPCDLVALVSLTVDGFPCLPSTNTFHQLKDGSCCGVEEFASALSTGTYVDNFGNIFATNIGTTYTGVPLTYELNNDWITLSVKTGKVCIAYLAHPVDCDGFIMIPDNVSYKEAITRCLIMRLDYLKWRQNPSDQGLKALYQDSEQQYNFYINQAMNAAKAVDINGMEAMKNMLLRLKPLTTNWANNFSTLSLPEIRPTK